MVVLDLVYWVPHDKVQVIKWLTCEEHLLNASSGEGDDFLVCAGNVNSHALELEVLDLGVEFQLVLIVLCLKLLAQTLELVI